MSSEQQNETTANVTEPLEVTGGSGAVSFDELEQVQNMKVRQAQVKSKEEKQLNATTLKNADEKPEKKEKSEEKPEKKEKVEAKADKKEEKASTEAKEQAKVEAAAKRAWKIKYGDKDVELFEDMKIPVKVDGQEVETTFSDLLNGYSGQTAISKRFQQFNEEKQKYVSEKKKFDEDKTTTDQFIKSIFEATKGNPIQGLALAAEYSGLDPVEYQMSLAESLAGFASKWSNMTDLEKQHYRLSLENERYKAQLNKEKTKTQSYEGLKQIDEKVNRIQEEFGVTRQQFAEAYYELEQLKESGKLKEDITPEMVRESLKSKAMEKDAYALVVEAVPQLADNKEAVKIVSEIMSEYQNLTKDDVKDILKDYYQKNMAGKVREKASPKQNTKAPANPMKDVWSFDQLTN